MKRVLLLLLLLAACAPPIPNTAPSLAIVPPDYYSRVLHYTIRKHRGKRTISRTYDIPVRVERKTGDVLVESTTSEKVERQIGVIQTHLNNMKGTVQQHEQTQTVQ